MIKKRRMKRIRPAVIICLSIQKNVRQLSFGSRQPLSKKAEENPDVAQQMEHSDAWYSITLISYSSNEFLFSSFSYQLIDLQKY